MSYQKQPQLNGGYYGPAIPPPDHPRSSHRPRRSGGRSCCGRCGCCLFDCVADCGCCLLSCVFKIICSILVFIGIIILIAWLIVRPHHPNFHATGATLTAFNLSGNQLSYNLALNLTVRNPNKHMKIYYDTFEVNAFYADQRFATKDLDPFSQGTKNTTDLGPVSFVGTNAVALKSDQRNDYESQKNDGEFKILLRMHLKVRFKIGLFKTGKFKPKVKCDMTVPLASSSKVASFETTKCDYYF